MATILSVSGSPSAVSRTSRLLRHLDERLSAQGHEVIPLDVRDLPAEALLGADFRHPALVRAAALVEQADGVVAGTPISKAACFGPLKSHKDIAVGDDGPLTLAPAPAEALAQVTDRFFAVLGGRTTLLAATG